MKNFLLFSIFFLAAIASFAQLTVKPNGTADSYVYVKNQILYVEGPVNLTKNLSPTVEASIYLRDNGQLIQGGTTSTNSGNGQLSAQQNSPVTNAFAYYYWCSPIGNAIKTDGTATPAGNNNFGVSLLYEPSGSSLTAAAPVLRTTERNGLNTTTPITVSTRWLYTHLFPGDEAEVNYQRMNSGNNAPAGKGFTMKGVGDGSPSGNQVYDYRGRPNNGDFPIPVLGPVGTHPDVNAMMTLTGNPYPSALDLNKLFFEPSNGALSAIYYYDEDRTKMSHNYSGKPFGYGVWIPNGLDDTPNNDNDFPGAYTSATFYIWNAAGNQGSNEGAGTVQNEKRYAPIGQGFMFVGNTGGDVIIKNTHRVFIKEGAATNSVFQRPTTNEDQETAPENENSDDPTASEIEEVDYRTPQMRLYAVFDQALTRDMLLLFSDQATDGYDRGYDGLSPMGMDTDAYFPVGVGENRLPYVINAVNYYEDKQIPIAFKLDKTTQINLNVVEQVKKPYNNVYLFDSQENTYKRMAIGQVVGAVLNLPAGTYDNRFFIVFNNPNLPKDVSLGELEEQNKLMASVNLFQNNPLQQLEISNPEGYNLKSASMYDMSGKMVIQEQNLGSNNSYSFYTGNLSDGVYLVKLTTSQDLTIDFKAIVSNK